MTEKHRPGSMAAAEAKNTKRFFIGASVIVGIIILLFVLPIPTFFHGYYKRTDLVFKILGFILSGGWYWFLWIKSSGVAYGKKDSATGVSVLLLIWFALICATFGGFNFDLSGIE